MPRLADRRAPALGLGLVRDETLARAVKPTALPLPSRGLPVRSIPRPRARCRVATFASATERERVYSAPAREVPHKGWEEDHRETHGLFRARARGAAPS